MRQSERADELNEELGLLCAQEHAISAKIVEVLAELDEVDGWQSEGLRTMAQFLSVRGSYTIAEARRFQTAALRLDRVRSLHADAAEGRYSVGVLAMAARVATPENEHLVRQIVRTAVPSQAERIFAKYRDLQTANDEPEPDPEVDYWEKHWTDDLGRERIDMALDGPTGARFREAWAAMRAAGEKDLEPTDLEQRRRLNANEIANRMAQAALDAANGSGMSAPGGEKFCVQVSVDLMVLARILGLTFDPNLPVGLGEHCFIPATGKRLTDAEVGRIPCDSSLQLLVHHNGVPLWLGREVRTATRHQRRALRFRAGVTGCEFPGCTQTRFVDAHHVTWWEKQGLTDLDNLMLLCSYHHKQIHDNGWKITTNGDQEFTFWRGERCLGTTTRGNTAGGRPPDVAQLPVIAQPPDPPAHIHANTAQAIGGGERLTTYALSVYLERLLAA